MFAEIVSWTTALCRFVLKAQDISLGELYVFFFFFNPDKVSIFFEGCDRRGAASHKAIQHGISFIG